VDPIFVAFDLAAALLLAWWLVKLLRPTHHMYAHWRGRVTVAGALAASLGVIAYVLRRWASFDVVDDPYYVLGYLSLGLLWITAATKVQSAVADIRLQQDVRDRNNWAAAIALGGLLLGNAAAYAGGNVGDGPGVHVVFFSALLAAIAVTVSMWLVAACTDSEERITVDHDAGAALRVAAVAIAVGIVAGRSVAGDWVSIEATMRDFAAVGWPLVPLVVVGIVNERLTPPAYAEAGAWRSVIFTAVLLFAAGAYVDELGTP
jgi:uncharacterized membrane protein YjfL (UPF0719 family)